jgi:hypothetical protein
MPGKISILLVTNFNSFISTLNSGYLIFEREIKNISFSFKPSGVLMNF